MDNENEFAVQEPQKRSSGYSLFTCLLLSVLTFTGGYMFGVKQAGKNNTSIKMSSVRPSLSPSPTPDPTTSWLIYTNSKFTYSFKYPSELSKQEEDYSTSISRQIKESVSPGIPNPYILYVSVIPPGFWENGKIYNQSSPEMVTNFFDMKVDEERQVEKTIPGNTASTLSVFKRLNDITINNISMRVFENNNLWGYAGNDRRYFFQNNNNTYMIGSYYQTEEELAQFMKIFNTFSLLMK